MWFA